MLPIHWSAEAADDLDEIVAYIAKSNPQAAERLQQRIEAAVLPLSRHPYMCRAGRVARTREMVIAANYILIYRVSAVAIDVLRVRHGRRQYP